jgi:imidazole glycerol phosphate synthase glutamine amidotransferase subunit
VRREKMITVIDFGAGNLNSVRNALSFLNIKSVIARNGSELETAKKIIFPGVGAFEAMMEMLKEREMSEVLKEKILEGIPFLGICLGMQALFESSEESPGVCGLKVFKGKNKRFEGKVKVPQMGWNKVKIVKKDSPLFNGMKRKAFVFFANSYFVKPKDKEIVSSYGTYGERFCASIESGNVFGVQFHPEKSGKIGLKILKNFARIK